MLLRRAQFYLVLDLPKGRRKSDDETDGRRMEYRGSCLVEVAIVPAEGVCGPGAGAGSQSGSMGSAGSAGRMGSEYHSPHRSCEFDKGIQTPMARGRST